MESCFSSNEPKIKIIDVTSEGSSFDYLRPNGTITYSIDKTYNTPLIEFDFDGWFESSVLLWPKNNVQDQIFYCSKEHLHLRQVFLLFHLKVEFLILYFSLRTDC